MVARRDDSGGIAGIEQGSRARDEKQVGSLRANQSAVVPDNLPFFNQQPIQPRPELQQINPAVRPSARV